MSGGASAYKSAGVDLEAGYEAVARMKKHVQKTMRSGAMGAVGGFGGLFDLSAVPVKEPVLVSGTDGVGTKLKLAFALAGTTPSASTRWRCASTTLSRKARSPCSSSTTSPARKSTPRKSRTL